MRRNRRYWHTWQIQETEEATIEARQHTNVVTLVGESPQHARAFEGDAQRAAGLEDTPFATFVRAIPRKQPPPSPRGIDSCLPHEIARWKAHDYRYPPYQYKDRNGVWGPEGWRPLNANERERRMGYEPGHTLAALTKDEIRRDPRRAEDVRCALIGNAFYVPAIAWLLGDAQQQSDGRLTSAIGP
jgi:hypothetical protein